MRKFDTKVQHLKYKVLREVARLAWEDKLLDNLIDIPKIIAPGKTPRCAAVYTRKEQFSVSVSKWLWEATKTTPTLSR